uniref:Putative ovule protein n=1 Tax=Solanum chacoense TaxID=4108 RepID=A0A0V0GYZ0_SOLCH
METSLTLSSTLISLRSIRTRNSGNRFVFRFQSQSSAVHTWAKTTLQWFHSFLLYFWVNPTRMGRRGSAKLRSTLYVC